MFMSDSKKKPASIIVASMGKSAVKAPETADGAMKDSDMAMEAAGEELLAAIESKSPKAVMEALKAAYDLCESQEDEAPSMEEQV